MESLSKQELISTITKQADQIKRYEGRLRDVVTAYKGLIKEKEALEIQSQSSEQDRKCRRQWRLIIIESSMGCFGSLPLCQSLSALTEEKSRMEEAFQADKKLTRDKYENQIASIREETKTLVQQHLAEINNLKAKTRKEIQERRKGGLTMQL
ncbi:unnamed protein product [Arctia plantaginis]|uniref:Uncharacterized protein n=1 Tax=Arctia plantaginis TaxID=874455 RepID=A0A8S1ARC4_ARCPL|nr:unnamed protein product [Arctia plantaginis]